jgi:NAD(P)-dependent dehydrogenase (short-subunit alcohol dehydrogenase family)
MSDSILESGRLADRLRLDGRTALITGAGGLIGRAIAHAYGEMGAKVALAGRRAATLEPVADELATRGVETLLIEADVADEASVDRMVRTVVAAWGELTIAVNNAGAFGGGEIVDLSLEEWRRVMSVNLDGTFLCARAEARVMREAGYGKILNTASISGMTVPGWAVETAYSTSKAAVIQLTRLLAAELGPHGIRVNSISPGVSNEAEPGGRFPAAQATFDFYSANVPLGGIVPLADIQGAAVYLASASSDSTTGHNLVIDRGYTLA